MYVSMYVYMYKELTVYVVYTRRSARDRHRIRGPWRRNTASM